MARLRHVDAICGTCTAGASVVCMSSMAAALAATGAAAGAGAAGMGGMGSMGGETASGGTLAVFPALLDALGLGFLSRIPNEILQPVLVAMLALSVVAAYLAYRGHRRPQALVLTGVSGSAMYASIYVVMSEPLYALSLAGLVGSSLWGIALAREPRPSRA